MAVFAEDEFHLKGGPGTGKTVVSLWRHIENWARRNRRSLLLTYTKSLEYYLKNAARSENENAGNNINRTFKWTSLSSKSQYHEIIIDEAQDVPINRYHIIKNYAKIVSYGSDKRQSLYQNGASESELSELFPINTYELCENFRNSREILRFVRSIFPNIVIDERSAKQGQKPKLIITDNIDKVKKVLKELIDDQPSTENLAILVPFKNVAEKYKAILNEIGATYSCYYNNNDSKEEIDIIENIHITTFKSSKGLEFDTVIIPEFQKYKYNIINYDIISENDYFVALTRTRRNLFLLCDYRLDNLNVNTYDEITL